MLYTNIPGPTFYDAFSRILQAKSAELLSIDIASGYVFANGVDLYEPIFEIPKLPVRILFGMALEDGVSPSLMQSIYRIKSKNGFIQLRVPRPSSNVSASAYHGKIYRIKTKSRDYVFAGSANLSEIGHKVRREAMFEILGDSLLHQCNVYIDDLTGESYSYDVAKDEDEFQKLVNIKLNRGISDVTSSKQPALVIPLDVDRKEKSGINTFNGTPRSGEIHRNWYEIELSISGVRDKADQIIPIGEDFYLTTGDRDSAILCFRSGDRGKEIRSRGSLRTLGSMIKDEVLRLDPNSFVKGFRKDGSFDSVIRPISKKEICDHCPSLSIGLVLENERINGHKLFRVIPF